MPGPFVPLRPSERHTAAVHVLLLSNSDASGARTGGRGWGTMLAEDDGTELTVTPVEFFAGAPTAAAYAVRKVEQHRPDVVIVPAGSYGFAVEYVEFRVRRLFGKRAAGWYKRMERGFDTKTRPAGGAPKGTNSLVRRVVRRTFGADPAVSQQELTRNVGETLRRLAGVEDTKVVVVTSYPGVGALATRRMAPRRAVFLRDVHQMAAAHRFPLVNVEQPLAGHGALDELLVDDIHLSPAAHDLLAVSVRAAVLN